MFEQQRKQLIAYCAGKEPGPIVMCIGSLHGNEPAGVKAIELFAQELVDSQCLERGAFWGVLGSSKAYQRGERFVDEDLNRAWELERFQEGELLKPRNTSEDEEVQRILLYLSEAHQESVGTPWLIDLHTTSASTVPFIWTLSQQNSQTFDKFIPLPSIHDGFQRIHGTLAEFATTRGYSSLALEGGAHGDPRAVTYSRDVLWLVLSHLGLLNEVKAREVVKSATSNLRASRGEIPVELEVFYHHMIEEEDEFVMEPGFLNFQAVKEGQLLAHDRNGPINAIADGLILMPLYQSAGEDGFLLVKPK